MSEHKQEITDATMTDDATMVTLARFQDPVEAQMARSAVEAAGIVCFLQGENANSLIPMAFRTRLLVRPQDEAAAQEILDAAVDSPPSMAAVTEAEQADEAERKA